ncbi:MAG: M14 family zinc carboxypeptidase [Candidatus Cloacimonetes bacterium]|nr:M14 family zinc carboxypeptidase [Candidatus Cloacimonadota bacterium]
MKFGYFLLLLLIIIAELSASEIGLLRIYDSSDKTMKVIAKHDAEIVLTTDNYFEVLINFSARNDLEIENIQYEVIQTPEEISRAIDGYRDYSQMYNELLQISQDYPDIVDLFSLGPSTCKTYYLQGMQNYINYQHEIWCLKLSDNPTVEENEANVFFASTIHAREPISLEVNMHILYHLLENYGNDADISYYINNTQIWFIPLMNPDGHKMVIDRISIMHRKNLRDNNNDQTPISNQDGVDLNRNFGYVYGSNGTSSNPTSDTYRGPYAWSELESSYARDLIQARRFSAGVTYHSYGQWVLYPLGHLPGACSLDHEIMGNLATQMALTIPRISGTGHYTPAQAVDFGYTCQGTMGDWGYAEERVFAYTIELASSFIPGSEDVPTIAADNLEAAMIMLGRPHKAVLTGNITDTSGNPLEATIHIHEIDEQQGMSQVEPYTSSITFGRYDRLLLPGSYTVTFSAEGLVPKTYNNVIISSDAKTILDVTLREIELSIEIIDSQVNLNWNSVPNASLYKLYRSEDPSNFPEEPYLTTPLTYHSESITGVQKYFYMVTAITSE